MLITSTSHNNHFLYSNTAKVTSGDEAISVILALESEMRQLGGCVGIAAPQIGISKAVSIIRHKNVSINLINPELISGELPFLYKDEGCMSLPNRRFNVPRFGICRIKNDILWPLNSDTVGVLENPNKIPLDRMNPPKGLGLSRVDSVYVYDSDEETHGGIICVAVQHEIDHLLGKTIDKNPEAIEQMSIAVDSKWKVGRNDPCPCGKTGLDGRPVKFKKCCLSKMT